jgi:hypothetical protein
VPHVSGRLLRPMAAIALALAWSLSPGLLGPAQPREVRAAGCDPYQCDTLVVHLSGFGNATWQSANGIGFADGVFSCRLQWGIQTPASCSHRYEWGGFGSLRVYWTLALDPDMTVEGCTLPPCAGLTYGSLLLPNLQTTHLYVAIKPMSPVPVAVSKAGTGTGSITSTPGGISCGSTCSWEYQNGTYVTLIATPASGSTFASWAGGVCAGSTNPSCPIAATYGIPASYVATFQASPTAAPPTDPPASPKPSASAPGPTLAPPTPTPHATAPAQPTPSSGGSPGSSGAPPTASASIAPGESGADPESPGASLPAGAGSPYGSGASPVSAPSGSDPTLPTGSTAGSDPSIAIAIVVAAVILGLGMAFLGLQMRRRNRPGSPSPPTGGSAGA